MVELSVARSYTWLIVAFVVCALAVGIPYWQVPYSKVSLPNTLVGPGLLLCGVAAAVIRGAMRARAPLAILACGLAPAAAVMARVVVEVSKDSTSHNLWPFELVIALMVGGACATAGTLIGNLPALLLGTGRGDQKAK